MKIHEYQAKAVLRRYGVTVSDGVAAKTAEEAIAGAKTLTSKLFVVKSQIHAGGRGKGRFAEVSSDEEKAAAAEGHPLEGKGGVALCWNYDDVKAAADMMLGNTLITKQTGPEGKQVNTLYVEAGSDIDRELYLAVTLDRSNHRILFMASTEGGTEIEDVAEENPDAITRIWIDPATGMQPFHARQLAYKLGLDSKKLVRQAVPFFIGIYNCYVEMDCDMIEINPLLVTPDEELKALDCKMSFDGNSLYRHKDVVAMRDLSEEDPAEVAAGEHNLSFIKLDGQVGCLVNGAGLAMATMDIIKFKGGEPANFLDVGGGATEAQVTAAFEIITRDPSVKAILVNIFGGIMQCDIIARGIIAAIENVGLSVPLIVRLAGTNADLGKKILAESGLNIIPASTLDEAAEAAVSAAQG